jgi:Ni,Fe-hydrogenase III large subunit
MSIDIVTALRQEAGKAQKIAERVSNPDDKDMLARLTVRLLEIAERLERDARD